MITIHDLSREELIALLETRVYFLPSEHDLWRVRYTVLCKKARQKREESLSLSLKIAEDKSVSTEKIRMWEDSLKLWDEGERIQKRAEKIYNERLRK